MTVGFHQGSVYSPLMFAVIMDIVSSEERSGLPFELLYVDGLNLIPGTIEHLARRVAECGVHLLNKGLTLNA